MLTCPYKHCYIDVSLLLLTNFESIEFTLPTLLHYDKLVILLLSNKILSIFTIILSVLMSHSLVRFFSFVVQTYCYFTIYIM